MFLSVEGGREKEKEMYVDVCWFVQCGLLISERSLAGGEEDTVSCSTARREDTVTAGHFV